MVFLAQLTEAWALFTTFPFHSIYPIHSSYTRAPPPLSQQN
jgi:hypothetical protein